MSSPKLNQKNYLSGVTAHVVPMQDAGLHTYLRSLDIQFGSIDSK